MTRVRPLLAALGRWLTRSVFLIGALNVAAVLVALVLWLWPSRKVPEHTILHLTLDGSLREGPAGPVASLAGSGSPDDLLGIGEKLRAAATDPRVVGLFVEVKEPKVGPAQSSELSRAVQLFAASKKPTWSYLDSAGEGTRGDGAYALASMANTVMLAPCGEVSLFGMRADVPFVKGALSKLHVDAFVEQRYEYKSFADTFAQEGFTKAHKESMQSLLGDLQQSYLHLVGAHRSREPNQVRDWVLGAPYPASAAKHEGLVDLTGYREDMLQLLKQASGTEEPLLALASYDPPRKRSSRERIALVTGTGEITRGEGSRTALGESDGMGSDTFVAALRDAREQHVDGILLRLNSPGGSYLASDLIRHEIELARQQNIPVVVSMGDVAASGGYHIASAADHIVAEQSTITGSIGVVGVSFAVRRALSDFLGVQFGSLAALPHPGTMGFLDPPDAADAAVFSRNMDRIYQDFVGKVASGRRKAFAEVHEVGKGRVWTGQQALGLGLVDELGGYATAMQWLRNRLNVAGDTPLTLVAYPEPSSAWALLRDALGGQASLGHLLREQASWLVPMGQALRAAAVPAPQAKLPDAAVW